ncbi:MAG: C1 family peptidase [Candidatus Heimdallarchaeaceae archaeon]
MHFLEEKIHASKLICPCKRARLINARTRMKMPLQMKGIAKLKAKFHLNYKRDPEDGRDFLLTGSIVNLLEAESKLPERVDHEAGMSPVKNQGQLGSCVGFAVSAMKEFQERKEHLEEIAKGKRGRPKVYDYSEAWVYWNSKKIDPWPGEEGTSIRYAMKVLQKIGVPTEKGWPYKDVGDIGEPKNWATMVARWALIDSYWRVSTLNELKIALVDGPLPIGIPCFYEIFFAEADGYIKYPANPDQIYGGHAICAVGYNDRTQLVKFKNSWGRGWGSNGYGYLPYQYIDDFLWDAWASKDLSVTKEMLKGTRELV